MMCEMVANIPANIPTEEKSSYVLTQDMIDAAMTEQFSYQEDVESEEESASSVEETGEQDSQERSLGDSNEIIVDNNVPTTNCDIDSEANNTLNSGSVENLGPTKLPVSSNNKLSVLVIETGLDKNEGSCLSSAAMKEKDSSNSVLDGCTDTNKPGCESEETVCDKSIETKVDLNILKSVLTDTGKAGVIDLCDSEVDDYSEEEEDDANGAEVIDDELRSVMETNLMAEIGMTIKKTVSEPLQKVEQSPPRISVKDIAHISNHAFNHCFSESANDSDANAQTSTEQTKKNNGNVKNTNFKPRNPMCNPNFPLNDSNQGPIQINKIAIPHASFVNKQGQRMRCVYVKNPSNMPYVINTPTQTIANGADLRYVLATPGPVQKRSTPVQMPAIAALKNLTKNIPQALMLPTNAKLVPLAQKSVDPKHNLNRPRVTQNVSKSQQQIITTNLNTNNNEYLDAYKSSLLFSAKPTYVAPDTFPEKPVYTCLDCNDKFILKSSLTNHVERRSMSISYWCQICKAHLQFFNKCALSLHLRGHNLSLRQVDLASIRISQIPLKMVENGIITTFFNIPRSILPKPTPNGSSNDMSNKNIAGVKTASSVLKPVQSMSSQKITTVAGQSKSVCYQSSNSSDGNRPLANSEKLTPSKLNSSNKVLPFILPKSTKPTGFAIVGKPSPVQCVNKESYGVPNKSPPKSLILFCNNLPQQNGNLKPCFNNVSSDVSKSDPVSNNPSAMIDSNDVDMIIDDDASKPPSTNEEELVDIENVDGSATSSSISTSDSKQENIVNGKGTKSTSNSIKRTCSECNVYYPNVNKHLNGNGRPNRKDLACKICSLILPSKCALQIHHRIHMKIPPYKCPDCGKDFTAWNELHSHLKFSCGHFAKCIRYICSGCKAHFPTQSGLAQHIAKIHGRDIFKCTLCNVAFFKKPSLMKHVSDRHKDVNFSDKASDYKYKQCEMCPKQLVPEESFFGHAKEHTNAMIYGYKCSMCNIVYANKMSFIIHQIKEKASKDNLERFKPHKKPEHIIETNHVEEPMQALDSNSDVDVEDEPLIVRKFPENDDGASLNEKDPLCLDGWENAQQKVQEKTEELCIVCKKNSVVLLPGIDLNSQSLCCKQCVKPLDDDGCTESGNGLQKNVSRTKSKSKSQQENLKRVHRSSSTEKIKSMAKKRRTSDPFLNSSTANELLFDPLMEDLPSKKKSKSRPKDKLSPKRQTHIQGQVIKSRSCDELSHKCSKCDFVSENRESFFEHIKVHRTDPNTYQCLECGLCFVVLPSLEMHLQMHHGVKDVSSYTENNQASLPQKSSLYLEEEAQENQCRVCYETFDCKTSLDKHFRIHGMAFMSELSKSP